MDKANMFRAIMVIAAIVVLIALIAVYRSSTSERFSATASMPAATATDPSYASEQYPFKYPDAPTQVLTPNQPAAAVASASSVLPSEPMNNEQYRAVDFPTGVMQPATASPGKRLTTEDLLPKDAANTKWAQVTPSGQGELRDLNFMTAGWHIGVNTQGQSLRNPNMQLRSDPINPQYKVSPWNMSTVEPDVSRRPFEIA
jgi:hypothetical protein